MSLKRSSPVPSFSSFRSVDSLVFCQVKEMEWGEGGWGWGGEGYGRKMAGESCYNCLYALITCDTQAVCKETMINDMYQCIRL